MLHVETSECLAEHRCFVFQPTVHVHVMGIIDLIGSMHRSYPRRAALLIPLHRNIDSFLLHSSLKHLTTAEGETCSSLVYRIPSLIVIMSCKGPRLF